MHLLDHAAFEIETLLTGQDKIGARTVVQRDGDVLVVIFPGFRGDPEAQRAHALAVEKRMGRFHSLRNRVREVSGAAGTTGSIALAATHHLTFAIVPTVLALWAWFLRFRNYTVKKPKE